MLAKKLYEARHRRGISQGDLAEAVGVSRQAIQKWESGTSVPGLDNLVSLAAFYNLSLDYLLKDNNVSDDPDAVRVGKEILPNYSKYNFWEAYYKLLAIEYKQSIEEGLDISSYENLFNAVAAMPDGKAKDKIADVIFDIVENAPIVKGYKYTEPSELEAIRALRDGYICPQDKYSEESVFDKVYGGWLGRICGCFLGKPVEGIKKKELTAICKRTGNYPLHRYFVREEMTEKVTDGISFKIAQRAYPKNYGKMPSDDDTNYMVISDNLLQKYGRDFTAANVAESWIRLQGKNAYCTAERVAYRNFVNGYLPPESAVYKNPFREWIGAQIRGDYFGYINPLKTEEAADMAFRDASISHIKNGIYGEMWVSAMIAAAFGCNDVISVIRAGLSEIPKTSRLYEAVYKVIEAYRSGISVSDFFEDLHKRWDEYSTHDWCHTISNAEIVTASLLWGEKDYGKSICFSVAEGFDTDCNGATVGSVLGVMLGASALPSSWTNAINDTLMSTVFGYEKLSVREMAENTMKHM